MNNKLVMMIFIILLIIFINLFVLSAAVEDYNCNSNLSLNKKNDTKNDSNNIYYYYAYIDKKVVRFNFLISELFNSISEIKSIESFNHKNKNYLFYEYYNIHKKKDKDSANNIFWNNFYNEIYHLNYSRIDSIVLWFTTKKYKDNLTEKELLSSVVRFVQDINFKRPYQNFADFNSTAAYVFDFYTPNEMFFYEYGDCDTKSLLLILILDRLGYDTVLFLSNDYNHVMAGVNFKCNGKYMEYEGEKYYFIETTLRGFKIGKIITGWGNLSKWKIVPIK